MAKITLLALASKFIGASEKVHAVVNLELRRVGQRVRDTATRKFGHYQPEIGPYPAWVKLTDDTIEAKERAGGAEDPLIGHYMAGKGNAVWPVPLRTTIEYHVVGLDLGVGTADPLGVYHEYGTKHIPPRPFLRPAVFENEEYFETRMAIAMETAIRMM